MSKKKRNRNKNRNAKKTQFAKQSSDVIVAPVVMRATDEQALSSGEVSAPDTTVVDAYLEGSAKDDHLHDKTQAQDAQKDRETNTSSKNPFGGHVQTRRPHTCQSPQLRKKVKNLTSLLIIASGFAAGSLFIDLAQFFTERGLSARALGEARIVSYDGATWVKYDEPKVNVDVFTSRENSTETMEQIDGLLSALSYSIPTLEARMVDVDTEIGASRAKNLDIAYVPAMHFSATLSESPYYQVSSNLFKAKSDGTYLLQMDVMDITIDHFLESPDTDTGAVIGVGEAPHQVVMFENFLCDTCVGIHDTLTAFQAQNPSLLKIVYKNIPTASEQASKDAAMAGYCAYAQGSYEEYARILYTNSAWKSVESELREDLFLRYAGFLPQVDLEAMRTCYTVREYDGQLIEDITEANRLGIVNVPTVFVDGVVLRETEGNDLNGSLQVALDALFIDGDGSVE